MLLGLIYRDARTYLQCGSDLFTVWLTLIYRVARTYLQCCSDLFTVLWGGVFFFGAGATRRKYFGGSKLESAGAGENYWRRSKVLEPEKISEPEKICGDGEKFWSRRKVLDAKQSAAAGEKCRSQRKVLEP